MVTREPIRFSGNIIVITRCLGYYGSKQPLSSGCALELRLFTAIISSALGDNYYLFIIKLSYIFVKRLFHYNRHATYLPLALCVNASPSANSDTGLQQQHLAKLTLLGHEAILDLQHCSQLGRSPPDITLCHSLVLHLGSKRNNEQEGMMQFYSSGTLRR